MKKMNRTVVTIETNNNCINFVIHIPKSMLSEKMTRDFMIDTIIKTVDNIFYHNDAISPDLDLNPTLTVGTDTYDVKRDNVNETQIKKCDDITHVYLGSHITKEQFSDIANGNFIRLPIGSYWNIYGTTFRIMAHDQFYGYNGIRKHHVVVMPDKIYSLEKYNSTNTNNGGYNSSDLKKYIENTYNTIIEFIFGANHILTHTHDLTSGTYDNGTLIPTDNTKAWLINSYNVDGNKYPFETNYNWKKADKIQFPAFKYDSSLKLSSFNSYSYGWLLGSSASNYSYNFCLVGLSGTVSNSLASTSFGVRPAFLLY